MGEQLLKVGCEEVGSRKEGGSGTEVGMGGQQQQIRERMLEVIFKCFQDGLIIIIIIKGSLQQVKYSSSSTLCLFKTPCKSWPAAMTYKHPPDPSAP